MKESGRFVLRVNPELHASLKRQAREKNLSLNQIIIQKLNSQSSTNQQYDAIVQYFGDELIGILLFGSVARADQRQSSDIDLLVVLEKSTKIERQLYRLWDEKIQSKIGTKYSPQFSHCPDLDRQISSLWLEASLEGEILFDPKNKLRKIVLEIKSKIASGLYVRRMTNGHPYWVYQGDRNE